MEQGKATTVQDCSGKCLTEEGEILNRWTEYCTELYNHKANGDQSVLDCPQTDTEDDHPILRKEVESAIQSLKKGKSAGVDNIQAELVQADGVKQGCLLSTTLFNIFLERIMTDALEDHEGTVSIGGRAITNLRFADDIDGLAGDEEELAKLVERLDKASTAYAMEISAEKTKLMTNNTNGINIVIKINGQKLETATSFKYLGSVITE